MPLHLAARRGNADAVAMLLHFGAPVDAQGENGWTALHEAAACGSLDCVEALLRYRADLRIKNDLGETPHTLFKRLVHSPASCLNEWLGKAPPHGVRFGRK